MGKRNTEVRAWGEEHWGEGMGKRNTEVRAWGRGTLR